ncbi:hypothetical protein K491DRAFT_215725 [Lophiostoma macrostomum CBS 122681]|uniref:Uncharacterized protein n=1 Tax=Lophiostoma macrostomum CBS 122681 TaxID=1314788 RepID=A0A6A6TIC3_9PLEO|nr:hypothetical protein K491DRAFT_215725 [Lophiostoma macrostomum CBS 122681]
MPSLISGIPVVIGRNLGNPQTVCISERARASCPSFSTMSACYELPSTSPQTFQIVLRYLDGEDTNLKALDYDQDLPLQFVRAWTLAGELQLPHLQDRLVERMQTLYNESRRARVFAPGVMPASQQKPYTADVSLKKAFDHLSARYGSDTCAEQLLVSFVSRTALDIKDLELQIRGAGITRSIRKAMLKEARSLGPDPIRYDLQRFKGSSRSPVASMPLIVPPRRPVATSHTSDVALGLFEDDSSLGSQTSNQDSELDVAGHHFFPRIRRPGSGPPSTLMPHLRGGAGSAGSSVLESFRSARPHVCRVRNPSTISPLDSISSTPSDSMVGSDRSSNAHAYRRNTLGYGSSRLYAPISVSPPYSHTSRSDIQQQRGGESFQRDCPFYSPRSRQPTHHNSSYGSPATEFEAHTTFSTGGRQIYNTDPLPPRPRSDVHMPHNSTHRYRPTVPTSHTNQGNRNISINVSQGSRGRKRMRPSFNCFGCIRG